MLIQYIINQKQICEECKKISLEFGHSDELIQSIHEKYKRHEEIIKLTEYNKIPEINNSIIESKLEDISNDFDQELRSVETDVSIIILNDDNKFICDKELGVHVYDEIIQNMWVKNVNIIDMDKIIDSVRDRMKGE